MEFFSYRFFAFLLFTIIVYYSTRPSIRWLILLISSLIFIYSYSLYFLVYTLLYAIINYLIVHLIFKYKGQKPSKYFYFSGIGINIGLLIFFKYSNFFIDNISQLCNFLGISSSSLPHLSLIVPLGISFFTFQAIGYLIDVNRNTLVPEKSPWKFILFIVYFPKYLSGPVERGKTLLPEINRECSFDEKSFNSGILQILWGFTKTHIISDRLALIVNEINHNLHSYSGSILFINFFIQLLYLYFNFSGYTDIVLGISKLFGIKLSINFNRPFLAVNVSEYWRRWHISLTSWCNDYIFRRIILKKIRWGKWASVYGVFITFLVIGIWHGANWTFVILGILQGIAINYEFFTKKYRIKYGGKLPHWLNTSLSRLITYVFMSISIVLFFSKNIQNAIYYFHSMFNFNKLTFHTLETNFHFSQGDLAITVITTLIILLSEYHDEYKKPFIEFILKKRIYFWASVYILLTALILFKMGHSISFVYEQF